MPTAKKTAKKATKKPAVKSTKKPVAKKAPASTLGGVPTSLDSGEDFVESSPLPRSSSGGCC